MITLHGHGTWMPDHPRGYVHRAHGLQPPDANMAAHYRARQTSRAVTFDQAAQTLMIEVARDAGPHIHAVVHGIGAESTHVHILMSWAHDRAWKAMRASLRSALSRALNFRIGRRDPEGWFSDTPWVSWAEDEEHFDQLVLEYLPDHSRCWVREADRLAAESRDAKRTVSVRKRKR
jgi:hypothetical protein